MKNKSCTLQRKKICPHELTLLKLVRGRIIPRSPIARVVFKFYFGYFLTSTDHRLRRSGRLRKSRVKEIETRDKRKDCSTCVYFKNLKIIDKY